MALGKDRNTRAKEIGLRTSYGVAAGAVIYVGAQVAVNAAGYLVPADKTTAGLRVVGRSEEHVDNTAGSAGDLACGVCEGVFGWANDANAITQADVGRLAFVVDDQTVADETEGSATVAGVVHSLVGDQVYVASPSGPSDVGVVSTADALADAGAASVYTRTTRLAVSGAIAITLADGRYEGQRKNFYTDSASNTATLTPATKTGFTSIAFDAAAERAELEWSKATGWRLIDFTGATPS